MLTRDTARVIHVDMIFVSLIERWGVAELAADLELPTKNVRRWVDSDSIPAEWFAAIGRAAEKRGFSDVTVTTLADLAERRRIQRVADSASPGAAA